MSIDQLEVKFGLPADVRYCHKCVMSNQKPNTSIEYKNKDGSRKFIDFADGICQACAYNELKAQIDWKKREEKLHRLLDRYRRNDGRYDVIVPVSGGKDSCYTAHILKYKYGMHPLIVTWAPHLYTEIGWKNLQNLISIGGFDHILCTPNGKVHRLLTRFAFLNLLHPFQPFVFGQKNLGPRMSMMHEVPLVMYGESNVEYGDKTDSDDEIMSEEYFSSSDSTQDVFLGGVAVSDLLSQHGLSMNDLEPYLPAKVEKLRVAGTTVHYLGHYLKWDPQECYYYAVEHTGFSSALERSEGTYSKYTELDDKLIPLNFYSMHVKFGVGRAMYDAAQEVRNGKITREEGVALVRKFDGEYPTRWLPELLDYLSLTKEEFDQCVDRFRSPHLWNSVHGEWQMRHPIN